MKIVNGKLLGQFSDETEILRQQLDLRCGHLEDMLTEQKKYQLAAYRAEIAKFQTLCQEVGDRIEHSESSRFDKIEANLRRIKRQTPSRLLWLTFSSSIVIGVITMCTWLDLNSSLSPQLDSKIGTESTQTSR